MRTFVWLVSLSIFSAACSKSGAPDKPPAPSGPAPSSKDGTPSVVVPPEDGGTGYRIRVEEGVEKAGAAAPRTAVAAATKLDDAEVKRVLSRLKPVDEKGSDRKTFAMRQGSVPPPRTGETIQTPFPPPEAPPAPETKAAGPLEVLRVAPEGEISIAPNLSVTFSQPMVPVTSHADAIAQGIPVKVTPTPVGKWRWIGTQTLLFEPGQQFPKSTEYIAEVPKGTRSERGGVLASAKTWKFALPTVRLQARYPENGPHGLEPTFFASFDQAIDPDAVMKTVKLQGNGKTFDIRRISPEEAAKDERIGPVVKAAKKERTIAFRATGALPKGTSFTVTVGPGTPSAEGPLVTKDTQSWSFRTYDPLRVADQSCKSSHRCQPYSGLYISFNNPLDVKKLDPKTISVEPAIADMKIEPVGSSLYVRGRTLGRRTYKVTLPASLPDVFGQTLGSAETVSFEIGPANPALFSAYGHLVVLDPNGPKSLTVSSINQPELEVRLYAVGPEHWAAYREWTRRGIREKEPIYPPGNLRYKKVIPPADKPDELVDTKIDLSPALEDGHGQVIALVTHYPLADKQWERRFVHSWVQVTDLAVDAFVDDRELKAWVTQLKDGRPVEGAKIEVYPSGVAVKSDAQGLSSIPASALGDKDRILVARKGSDRVLLPENAGSYWWGGASWTLSTPGKRYVYHVFDDRKLYKPGEEVTIKGWVREVDFGRDGTFPSFADGVRQLRYEAVGPRQEKIATGTLSVGKMGGFDFRFKLADNVNLGNAQVRLTPIDAPRGDGHTHAFQIQEFRKPEFEVKSTASSGPHFIGGSGDASVTASYYAGGGLANTDVTWSVSAQQGYFTPPKRYEYIFGGWEPGWFGRARTPGATVVPFSGKTDGAGTHRVKIRFDSTHDARPMSVRAEATVQDVNRQTWSTTATLLVHSAQVYVGLKSPRTFVEKGQPLHIDAIAVDLVGKAVTGRAIVMRATRMEGGWSRGTWKEEEVDPQDCQVASAADAVRCTFKTEKGGAYRIRAEVKDADGRMNRTTLVRFVSGGRIQAKKKVEREEVRLLADKEKYEPGETAEILVQAPFYPAEGMMTLRRSGMLSTQRFELKGPTTTLRVPLEEKYLPSLEVAVDLVGSAARLDDDGREDPKLGRRPAFASGSLSLSLPAKKYALQVEPKPAQEKVEPGATTPIEVFLKDADGKPVANGEIALIVVDEAVLALTGYKLGSSLGLFYPYRSGNTASSYLRPQIVLAEVKELFEQMKNLQAAPGRGLGVMGGAAPPSPSPKAMAKDMGGYKKAESRARGGDKRDGDDEKSAQSQIGVRIDFRALAHFEPSLRTDADGKARTEMKVPDSLTRYRIMAVAVAGERQYGHGESTLTARLPLMVRPSAPRFLNFGDRFELPVVVQNQTDEPMEVKVAVRGANVKITDGAGRGLTVPANDRVEVRFPAAAAEVGTARFQMAAVGGKWADAAEVALPVWTPATTEAFATYGTLDAAAVVQPVKMPKDVFTEFGGLEIGTSSTALSALTDSVLYLVTYPYECSEQRASRILAVSALRDVLTAFRAEGLPPAEKIEATVGRDLAALQNLQNDDGGFPFWVRGYPSWPFLSNHVTHALVRAKAKGYKVPEEMLTRALRHLASIESYIPADYSESVKRAIRAYAVYVRALSGDKDVAKAKAIFAELQAEKEMTLEGLAWIYPVLSQSPAAASEVQEIRRILRNKVTETAATAHFAAGYGDGAYLLLYSDRRLDAILLEDLILDQKDSDLIPKIVRGLLGHRTKGRWANTQESTWVLLALDKYFNTYENVTPNFMARVWLGKRFAGEHAFRGRTTDRHAVEIPMSYLAESGGGKKDLVIGKAGPGRMYYRIGMRYAPRNLKLPPAEHGFTVQRSYEAVDDPKDVTRDSDGTWRVKAGARVRVKLTLVAPTRRYHVALVDPIPAGLEPLNPEMLGTQKAPPATPSARPGYRGGRGRHAYYGGWWRRQWYEHQNLRDERAEAFTSLLWAGVHPFSYLARATTPGHFVVPPTKAEEMYHPETFGRGAGDKVVVQ